MLLLELMRDLMLKSYIKKSRAGGAWPERAAGRKAAPILPISRIRQCRVRDGEELADARIHLSGRRRLGACKAPGQGRLRCLQSVRRYGVCRRTNSRRAIEEVPRVPLLIGAG